LILLTRDPGGQSEQVERLARERVTRNVVDGGTLISRYDDTRAAEYDDAQRPCIN
jgi:hypothetical protein